jgi:hypothetical protein
MTADFKLIVLNKLPDTVNTNALHTFPGLWEGWGGEESKKKMKDSHTQTVTKRGRGNGQAFDTARLTDLVGLLESAGCFPSGISSTCNVGCFGAHTKWPTG